MRLLGRNLMTLLLIAVMTIPAASSPALRHSHTDGDKSHQHGATSAERHAHGPRHSHSSRHRQSADAAQAKHSHGSRPIHSAQSPVEHLHVFWFGFQSSLPLSAPEQSGSPRPTASTEQWVPLISEVTLPNASRIGSPIPAMDLLLPTELTPRLPARSKVRPPHESVVAWLCDTARRERSGVLVI